jgi:hypothetical protein
MGSSQKEDSKSSSLSPYIQFSPKVCVKENEKKKGF